MIRICVAVLATLALPCVCPAAPASQPVPPAATPSAQVKVFLDCQTGCFADFLRADVPFVGYVRDRDEADVHVLVTSVETGSGGREYTLAFIGLKSFTGTDRTFRAVSGRADVEDVIRRQLANALRVGLLNYVVGRRSPTESDRRRQTRIRGPRRRAGDRQVEPLGVQRARVGVGGRRRVQPADLPGRRVERGPDHAGRGRSRSAAKSITRPRSSTWTKTIPSRCGAGSATSTGSP